MNQGLAGEFAQVMPQLAATGLLSSLCTIQQRPQVAGQPKVSLAGQVDVNPPEYTDIPGLVNIPCQFAVQSNLKPNEAGVKRYPEGYDQLAERHVLLNGYYPAILQQHQAVVDGVPYQINAVEHSSQKEQTRLAVRAYAK